MPLSTPVRVGLGLSLAALAIAGFAAASGQFSNTKSIKQADSLGSPGTPSERTETRIDAQNGTIVTVDHRGKDEQRDGDTSDQRGERSDYHIQARVDDQTGAVLTQDERNDDHDERGERSDRNQRRENGERDND